MRRTLFYLPGLAAICLFSIGCQTTAPDRKLSDAMPTAAKPLPAWAKHPNQAQSEQQLLISTKLIEVTRPAGSTDIPTKRYERKLSDPQFQVLLRELSQQKDADLMTAPSVVTRDGQTASVTVTREFVYPVEAGEDAKKEIENVGVTSHFDARHLGGEAISIKSFTRISEFDGFSEVKPGFDLPVFKRRDVETAARLRDGEKFLVGGILDETSQEIVDSGPLGIIKKQSTQQFSRELIIIVSAELINPEGTRLAAR